MIILNGKKFAKNDNEFVDALFKKGGTCVGYYKTYKRRIKLMDLQKNEIGCIANMVLGKASKLPNGKTWYSYATPTILEDANYNYPEQYEDLKNIYAQEGLVLC